MLYIPTFKGTSPLALSEITAHMWQTDVAANIFATMVHDGRALLQSPTGSGKTVIGGELIAKFFESKKVLFIVNKQVLVKQSYVTFLRMNLNPCIMHNTIRTASVLCETSNSYKRIRLNKKITNAVITLPETLLNNFDLINSGWAPDLIIFDEAHKSTSDIFQQLRALFPNVPYAGLTATPGRTSHDEAETLTEWYGTSIVKSKSIQNLIADGELVKPTYLQFNSEDDRIIDVWFELTRNQTNKRTIIFTSEAEHSQQICNIFTARGVAAEVITAADTKEINSQTVNQRDAILTRFAQGVTEVLVSVYALAEGFDERLARYCFICRNVGGVHTYQQIVGRVMRSHPDKSDCFVIDFGDSWKYHDPVEEYEWDLTKEVVRPSYAVVERNASVSKTLYRKKKRFWVTCICEHIYDIKKHDKCPMCDGLHGVKVSESVQDLMDLFEEHNVDVVSLVTDYAKIKDSSNLAEKLAFNARHNMTVFNKRGGREAAFYFLGRLKISDFTTKKNRKKDLKHCASPITGMSCLDGLLEVFELL
jgi:superfamily II DNA or RNA helicase